jgi:tetratricopeptide (TPR) repeat protein
MERKHGKRLTGENMRGLILAGCALLLFFFAFSPRPLFAQDVVKLVDGGEIHGRIVEETENFVKIETRGATVQVKRDEIATILKDFDFDSELKKRRSSLPAGDADALYKLGLWCEENKRGKEAKECFEEAVKINPEHLLAREKLHHKKHKGKWYTEEDYYKEIGWVNYGGVWMPKEDKDRYEAGLVKREDGTWIPKKEWDQEQKKIESKPKVKPEEKTTSGKEPKPEEKPDDTGDPAAALRLKERKERNPIPENKEERKKWVSQQLSNWNNYYESKHYLFLSNTSPDITQSYAKMMDRMYEEYCRIFVYKEEQKVPFLVHLYGSQREFMQKDRKGPGVGGYYDGSKIVCFLGKAGTINTQAVLFHEGTHQFEGLIWPDMDALTAKPGGIWMIEGLATYFECSEFQEGKLVTGLVNRGRVGALRSAMATNRYVRLPDLIRMTQRGYGPFHYAHGWGACYFFIHADKKLFLKFKEYFKEFKKTGIDPVEAFQRIFCTGTIDEEKLDNAWREYILNLQAG